MYFMVIILGWPEPVRLLVRAMRIWLKDSLYKGIFLTTFYLYMFIFGTNGFKMFCPKEVLSLKMFVFPLAAEGSQVHTFFSRFSLVQLVFVSYCTSLLDAENHRLLITFVYFICSLTDLCFDLFDCFHSTICLRVRPLPPRLVVMDAMTITTKCGGDGRYDHHHHLPKPSTTTGLFQQWFFYLYVIVKVFIVKVSNFDTSCMNYHDWGAEIEA